MGPHKVALFARPATGAGRARRPRFLEQSQPCRRRPQPSSDPDSVARVGTAAQHWRSVHRARDGDAHDELRPAAQVPSDHRAVVHLSGLEDAGVKRTELGRAGPDDADKGMTRGASHSCDVAQVDRHRFPPQVRERREGKISIDPRHHGVRRQQEKEAALRRRARTRQCDNSGIITRPDLSVRWAWQCSAKPGERLLLTLALSVGTVPFGPISLGAISIGLISSVPVWLVASGTRAWSRAGRAHMRDSSSLFLAANSRRLMTPRLRSSSSWLSCSATAIAAGSLGVPAVASPEPAPPVPAEPT
jgi:hypothetical protein